MTETRSSFAGHAAVYGLGAASMQLVSFLLLPLFTRYLSTADYGLLHLLYRSGELLNILLMFDGIRLATLNFHGLTEDESERGHIAASVTTFTMLLLGAGVMLSLAFADPLSGFLDLGDRKPLMLSGILSILVQATLNMPLTLMQARLESTAYVATTLGAALSRVILSVAFVVGLGWGIWGVVGASILSHGAFGVVLTLRELRRSLFRPDLELVSRAARFALPFIPTGMLFFFLRSGNQFFLVKTDGPDAVGIYVLGFQIATLATVLVIRPVFMVWQTWRYEMYRRPDHPVRFGEALTRISAVYLWVAMGIFSVRGELAGVLGPPAYAASSRVVGPVILAFYFRAMANFLDTALHIESRTDLKPWIALASTAATLGAYFLLIPRFGIVGAAYATLAGFFVHAVATLAVSQAIMFIRLEWKRLAYLALLTVSTTAILSVIPAGWAWVPVKLVVWLGWLPLLWVSELMTRQEKAHVRASIKEIEYRARSLAVGWRTP